MKIAVSATGKDINSAVDPRFGRAAYFVIVEGDSGEVVQVIDNLAAQEAAHGAGINAATTVANAGVAVVLTGRMGPKAFSVLQAAGIKIVSSVSGTVKEAVNQFMTGKLSPDSGPSSGAHPGFGPGGLGMGGGGRGMGGGGRGMGGGGRGGRGGAF